MKKVYKFNDSVSALDIEIHRSGDKKTAIIEQGKSILVLNKKLYNDIKRVMKWD